MSSTIAASDIENIAPASGIRVTSVSHGATNSAARIGSGTISEPSTVCPSGNGTTKSSDRKAARSSASTPSFAR